MSVFDITAHMLGCSFVSRLTIKFVLENIIARYKNKRLIDVEYNIATLTLANVLEIYW